MKNIIYENKSKPIYISQGNYLAPTPHMHKEIEIVYVINGECNAYADRKLHSMKKNDIFISFPNQVHYYENAINCPHYLIIVNPNIFYNLNEMLYDNIPECNVISLHNNNKIFKLIKQVFKVNGEFSEIMIVGLLNQVLALIMPQLEFKTKIKTDNYTLKNILKYCTHNFSNNISLDDIAQELHLNKYYISHLLNKKLGINFNSYINMLRINKACDLLTDTSKKIIDISEEVGFGSTRSLNRAFLKIMKCTPVEYREHFFKMNIHI